MKKLSLVLTLLFVILSQQAVYAQVNIDDFLDENSNNDAQTLEDGIDGVDQDLAVTNSFDIKVEIGTQSAWTKKVPIILHITPNIDSTRTQVSWDAPLGMTIENKFNDYFTAKKGQTVTIEGLAKVTQAGTYNVAINVTNWGYGENVSSATSTRLTFDENNLLTPRSAGYQTGVMIRALVFLFIFIILVVIGIFAGKKGFIALKKWLKPPQ